MASGRPAGLCRVRLAIAADSPDRRHALLVGTETAIGRRKRAGAIGAPRIVLRASRVAIAAMEAAAPRRRSAAFMGLSFALLSQATSHCRLSSQAASRAQLCGAATQSRTRLFWVTSSKTLTEYMFSGLLQRTDILGRRQSRATGGPPGRHDPSLPVHACAKPPQGRHRAVPHSSCRQSCN